MEKKIKKLYAEMAELTKAQCLIDCATVNYKGHIGGCCDMMYCLLAHDIMIEKGETPPPLIEKDGDYKPSYLGSEGCIIPPHFRPLCTVHLCEKSLWRNPEFSKKYFKLRSKIDKEESKAQTLI